jgi:hypothetical protein
LRRILPGACCPQITTGATRRRVLSSRAQTGAAHLLALAACIESERHRVENPPVPKWLLAPYEEAVKFLRDAALEELRSPTDPLATRSALALVALAAGETKLGVIISGITDDEIAEIAEEQLGWSEAYAD